MMAERRCIDEDGHCSICGYAIDMESETMESHECPPGFTQPPHDDLTAERAEQLTKGVLSIYQSGIQLGCESHRRLNAAIAAALTTTRQEALREAKGIITQAATWTPQSVVAILDRLAREGVR